MIESGFMGTDFNNSLHFSGFMGMVICKVHLLASFFGISGFMGAIFRKFSRFMGILSVISPDLWVVLSRLERHNSVYWKLK